MPHDKHVSKEFMIGKIRKLTDNEEIHFWCDELEGANGDGRTVQGRQVVGGRKQLLAK